MSSCHSASSSRPPSRFRSMSRGTIISLPPVYSTRHSILLRLDMRLISLLLLFMANATTTTAQSAAEHLAMGDRDYLAMNAESALNHYEQAAKIEPSSYEAFWKASRSAIDIGS